MLRRYLLVLCLALSPLTAHAQSLAPQTNPHPYFSAGSRKLLSGVAASASAGSRTVTLTIKGWARVIWQVDYTYNAGTALTMTCTASANNAVSYANINTVSISGGTATLSTVTWTKAVVASTNELISVDTNGYDFLRCVFSVTGGGASDLLDVAAQASAGW